MPNILIQCPKLVPFAVRQEERQARAEHLKRQRLGSSEGQGDMSYHCQ